MVVVTTSGYVVTIVGPYLADTKKTDASILNHMLKTNVEDFKNWVHEDDIVAVDRGFRDSLSLLTDLGIKAEMPSFLHKGDKQFDTDDANTNRLVTKVRWVVESANARIKNGNTLAMSYQQIKYHISATMSGLCVLSQTGSFQR
ncbi:uncharacterized protein LOC110450853 [Mizuhopecten yessoensis]|uniref:uncharacterized protein LOC110450853 n=1 Tax=Mizuhopecten yessoensis TaxID=6573 RepID=UPI000B458935|nr:uncharacterized protein LOC110450853 [Mizuhopecten yessoensis]